MKLDSKLFDAIRIKPRREEKVHADVPPCGWEGCDQAGLYKAPKGHRSEGQYHHFCLEHVRHYNNAFNFFSGMKPEEMDDYAHASASASGRATFRAGAAPKMRHNSTQKRTADARRFADPLHIFARYARSQKRDPGQARVKPLLEQDRRAFETLGFQAHVPAEEIKKAYKALVKIHHPDANGGDKGSEDRLRAIIAAYSHLKTKGFVA
jgi:DnaJ domain